MRGRFSRLAHRRERLPTDLISHLNQSKKRANSVVLFDRSSSYLSSLKGDSDPECNWVKAGQDSLAAMLEFDHR